MIPSIFIQNQIDHKKLQAIEISPESLNTYIMYSYNHFRITLNCQVTFCQYLFEIIQNGVECLRIRREIRGSRLLQKTSYFQKLYSGTLYAFLFFYRLIASIVQNIPSDAEFFGIIYSVIDTQCHLDRCFKQASHAWIFIRH